MWRAEKICNSRAFQGRRYFSKSFVMFVKQCSQTVEQIVSKKVGHIGQRHFYLAKKAIVSNKKIYCKSFCLQKTESQMVSVTIAKYTLATKNSYVYYHYHSVKLRKDLTFDLFAGSWLELT